MTDGSKNWYDVPAKLVKEVGFPIVVCGWLFYVQFSQFSNWENRLGRIEDVLVEIRDRLPGSVPR